MVPEPHTRSRFERQNTIPLFKPAVLRTSVGLVHIDGAEVDGPRVLVVLVQTRRPARVLFLLLGRDERETGNPDESSCFSFVQCKQTITDSNFALCPKACSENFVFLPVICLCECGMKWSACGVFCGCRSRRDLGIPMLNVLRETHDKCFLERERCPL